MQAIARVCLAPDKPREAFERQLQAIPAVLSAVHVTGDVDYEFRLACRDVADLGAALTVRHVTDVRTFVAIDGGMSDNPRERRRKPGAWPCGQGAPSRVVTGNGGQHRQRRRRAGSVQAGFDPADDTGRRRVLAPRVSGRSHDRRHRHDRTGTHAGWVLGGLTHVNQIAA